MRINADLRETPSRERKTLFTRSFLGSLRRKALQKRVWYSALDKVERGIITLSIRLIDSVQSATLGIEIVKITKKLRDALKSPFIRYLETFSLKEAKKIADQAIGFGNTKARDWVYDFGFTRYLTLINHNKPTGWGP